MRSVSIIPARTIRIDAASVTPSSVSTGSTSASGFDSGFVPGGINETGGSTSSQAKKKSMRRAPSTNSGSEIKRSEAIETT